MFASLGAACGTCSGKIAQLPSDAFLSLSKSTVTLGDKLLVIALVTLEIPSYCTSAFQAHYVSACVFVCGLIAGAVVQVSLDRSERALEQQGARVSPLSSRSIMSAGVHPTAPVGVHVHSAWPMSVARAAPSARGRPLARTTACPLGTHVGAPRRLSAKWPAGSFMHRRISLRVRLFAPA